MTTLLLGLAAVALVWWLSRRFAAANPAILAKRIKRLGGLAAFATAAFLAVRGRLDMAFLLAGAGAWLLGWSGVSLPRFGRRAAKTPGAVSRVRSAMIEMELDHDTGEMSGVVLAGGLAGRRLNDLPPETLMKLYEECRAADPDGVRLLEAYFDRRLPGWREHAQSHADTRTAGRARPGAMTEEEAYQILGLQPAASAEEIRSAHRALMKKLHPDQGGTTYLAARINEAKDVLLNRHR